jgi:hypothetical protein
LAWGSGHCLDLFFLRLLLLPIASLFASGHVGLLWLTTGYHLRATMGWLLLAAKDTQARVSNDTPSALTVVAPKRTLVFQKAVTSVHPHSPQQSARLSIPQAWSLEGAHATAGVHRGDGGHGDDGFC